MAEGRNVGVEGLLAGALRAGVDSCVYLPDSCLTPVIRAFQASNRITMVACTREDEGVAIAVGLHLGGRRAVCMMEASGLGYAGLILARAEAQRTPVVVIASHTRGPGEPYDYHGATIRLSDGIFKGLDIPYEIARDAASLGDVIHRVVQTAEGQLSGFGLLIPPHVLAGPGT